MEGPLADVWLCSSCGVEKQYPAAQLLALAAQACQEVSDAALQSDETVFSDRLGSLQVSFAILCLHQQITSTQSLKSCCN